MNNFTHTSIGEKEIKKGEELIKIFNRLMAQIPDPKIEYIALSSNEVFLFAFDITNAKEFTSDVRSMQFTCFETGATRLFKTVSDFAIMLADWYANTWYWKKGLEHGIEDYYGPKEVTAVLSDDEKMELSENIDLLFSAAK